MSDVKKVDKDKFIMGNANKTHKKLYLMSFWFEIAYWFLLILGIVVSIIIYFQMKDHNTKTWTAIWVALISPLAITWLAVGLEFTSKMFQDRIIKNYSSKNYLMRTDKEKQQQTTFFILICLCPPLLAIIITSIVYLIIWIVHCFERRNEDQIEKNKRLKEKEAKESQKKIAKQRMNAIRNEVKNPDLLSPSI